MVTIALEKIRYPDWYDIMKKSTDSEDEEKYLELRQDLVRLIDTVVSQEYFKNFVGSYIDERIHKITQTSQMSLDIRDVDLVFELIKLFTSKNVDPSFVI